MVCLLPSLQSLRIAFPEARIDVLCSPANVSLLKHEPSISRVHAFPYPPRERTTRFTIALLRELRQQQYDVVFAFYSRSHTHLATALSGAKAKVGFDSKRYNSFFTHVAHDVRVWHEVDRNIALIKAFGVEPVTTQPRITVGSDDEAKAQQWLAQHHEVGPLIALHAGASLPGRRYDPDKLAIAVNNIVPDARFVIFEGPMDEAETAVLMRLLKNVHVFRGSLLEMAALLAHCDLAIMNDSGPMHIAASMGTPTVGIFGDSHTYRWQPRGIAKFIQAPSRRFDDIRPEEITEAARQLIGQKAR